MQYLWVYCSHDLRSYRLIPTHFHLFDDKDVGFSGGNAETHHEKEDLVRKGWEHYSAFNQQHIKNNEVVNMVVLCYKKPLSETIQI